MPEIRSGKTAGDGCRRLSGLLEAAVLDLLMSPSQKPLGKALYLGLKSGALVLASCLSRQIHSPDLFSFIGNQKCWTKMLLIIYAGLKKMFKALK